MKVIDLLNMWANGELVKVKDEKGYFVSIRKLINNLNSEIELIEDTPKEDKKIEKLNEHYYHDEPALIDDMAHKINEIIDKVNKI